MSLKECPFCGSTDVEVLEILVRAWSGKCKTCDTLGPAEFAVKAWNEGTPRYHRVHKLEEALKLIIETGERSSLAIAREALE